jgi:hypothetical protein
VRRAALIAGLLAVLVGPPSGAAPPRSAGAAASSAAAPKINQLIVFRDGRARAKTVSTAATKVTVRRHRCAVGARTALAALVRSKPAGLQLHDFGSCSRHASDGAGLFVRSIAGDTNRGQNGWVYKVGRRAATAGAADTGGPFGRGLLKAGQRVTWFYCRMRDGGCQRTLEVRLETEPGHLTATVRGYDDDGKGVAVEGATVNVGRASGLTDATGRMRFAVAPGTYPVVASKAGLVRSFAERAKVR